MPKMKTKSSAKKRFKVSATGKVMAATQGKADGRAVGEALAARVDAP